MQAHTFGSPIDLSRDELLGLQNQRLQETVSRAAGFVPYYREMLRKAGLQPEDIHSAESLRVLPFTTKDALRDHYPWGLFAVPMESVARIHGSSGTTGKPILVGYSRSDLQLWAQLVARCLGAAGARAGDRIQIAYGYGLFTGGLGLHYGAEALGCTVLPIGGGHTVRQVDLIRDCEPTVIAATPSYLLAIADELERRGDARKCSLRIAVCGAEPWSEGTRRELEDRLGLTAVDIYGLSEAIGPGVGQEYADTQDGPTIWEDHFLPEIIDPETGEVLPDGSVGELVLTSLTKEAMTIIRYRTRDLTRLLPGTHGAMRRIERVRGRSDDMLIIRGVNVFPSQVEDVLTAEPGLSPHFVIEIERPQKMDVMNVLVESRAAVTGIAADELQRKALLAIKARIGLTATLKVVAPGTLPRSEGKLARVIDRRR